jgi:hypothetical protein
MVLDVIVVVVFRMEFWGEISIVVNIIIVFVIVFIVRESLL